MKESPLSPVDSVKFTDDGMTYNDGDAIVRLRRNMPGSVDVSFSDEDCRAYMHDLCIAICGSTEGRPEYYKAGKRLGGLHSSAFNSQVYERLKFPEFF